MANYCGRRHFGRIAVFETLKVTVDGANSPSQPLGDLLLEAPHVGEAQRLGCIFGRFAVFAPRKTFLDCSQSPSQLIGDLLLEAPHVGEAQRIGLGIFGRFAVFTDKLNKLNSAVKSKARLCCGQAS